MCPILGCRNRHAFSFAVDMGMAMQLTNIARDVLEDAKMGRRYCLQNGQKTLTRKIFVKPPAIRKGQRHWSLKLL